MNEPETQSDHSESNVTRLLGQMRDEAAIPVESSEVLGARRARLLPVLERLILVPPARVGVRWPVALLASGVLAAAAAAVLAFAMRRDAPDALDAAGDTPTGAASLVVQAAPTALTSAAPTAPPNPPLSSGMRVSTSVDRSTFTLENGASVVVGPSSAAEVTTAGDRTVIALHDGRVSVAVPALPRGAELLVRTEAGDVIVHGTRFTVVAGKLSGEPWFAVSVDEGVVRVVQRGVDRAVLGAGQSWRSQTLNGSTTKSMGSEQPASALAEQNRAFTSAMSAKSRGDDRAARNELTAFLAKWPDSPLASEARAELGRAEARLK